MVIPITSTKNFKLSSGFGVSSSMCPRWARSKMGSGVIWSVLLAVGWAKPTGRREAPPDDRLRVPTISATPFVRRGGHGAKSAFAHPTPASLLPLPRYHPLIRRLQPFPDARSRLLPPLHAEMRLPQFVHEFRPHFRAAFAQKLGTDAEFFGDREIFESPARHLRQDRQQFDTLFGKRIDSLLLMARVVIARDDALLEQGLQPIGQDVRRNALLGFCQQLAKMAAVAEHHVADHQQAPFVADHF